MTEDELVAVVAAATALLQREPMIEEPPAMPPWRMAGRIKTDSAFQARAAAQSPWSMHGRLRG